MKDNQAALKQATYEAARQQAAADTRIFQQHMQPHRRSLYADEDATPYSKAWSTAYRTTYDTAFESGMYASDAHKAAKKVAEEAVLNARHEAELQGASKRSQVRNAAYDAAFEAANQATGKALDAHSTIIMDACDAAYYTAHNAAIQAAIQVAHYHVYYNPDLLMEASYSAAYKTAIHAAIQAAGPQSFTYYTQYKDVIDSRIYSSCMTSIEKEDNLIDEEFYSNDLSSVHAAHQATVFAMKIVSYSFAFEAAIEAAIEAAMNVAYNAGIAPADAHNITIQTACDAAVDGVEVSVKYYEFKTDSFRSQYSITLNNAIKARVGSPPQKTSTGETLSDYNIEVPTDNEYYSERAAYTAATRISINNRFNDACKVLFKIAYDAAYKAMPKYNSLLGSVYYAAAPYNPYLDNVYMTAQNNAVFTNLSAAYAAAAAAQNKTAYVYFDDLAQIAMAIAVEVKFNDMYEAAYNATHQAIYDTTYDSEIKCLTGRPQRGFILQFTTLAAIDAAYNVLDNASDDDKDNTVRKATLKTLHAVALQAALKTTDNDVRKAVITAAYEAIDKAIF